MMGDDVLSRSWVTPMACFHAAQSASKFKNVDTDMLMRTTRLYVYSYWCGFPIKTLMMVLVGGLLFLRDTANDASVTTTRRLPPVCSQEPLK